MRLGLPRCIEDGQLTASAVEFPRVDLEDGHLAIAYN